MFLTRLFSKNKSFAIERSKTCAFTGHRPEKIYGKEAHVISELRREILSAIEDGYTIFVSGGSRGVDLWAADIVLELQRENKDIHLVCAIPFPGFDDRWPMDWKKHLQLVMKKADHIQIIEQAYSPSAYQKRNEFMCDNASRLIAVCDGRPSGTRNTIEYAYARGIPIRLIES